MTDDQSYGHVAVAFAEIARTLFSARTVGETLQQIVDFAVLTVEGCDAAGISLWPGHGSPRRCTPTPRPRDRSVQYETGEGPCSMPLRRKRSSSPKTWPKTTLADLRSNRRHARHAEPALLPAVR